MTGYILFADDESLVLTAGRMMLEQLGFTVYTAVNGLEAVEIIQKQEVDFCVVVLDILMPVMNGIEAMKEIRKTNPSLPILLISGYSEGDFPFWEDQESRPDAFIVKPVHLDELRDKLEGLLKTQGGSIL